MSFFNQGSEMVNKQYEMIIEKLNQELQKSLFLSQEYRANYQNLQEQSEELNKKNLELRKEI